MNSSSFQVSSSLIHQFNVLLFWYNCKKKSYLMLTYHDLKNPLENSRFVVLEYYGFHFLLYTYSIGIILEGTSTTSKSFGTIDSHCTIPSRIWFSRSLQASLSWSTFLYDLRIKSPPYLLSCLFINTFYTFLSTLGGKKK